MILTIETSAGEQITFDLTAMRRVAGVFRCEIDTPKIEVASCDAAEPFFVERGLGDRVTLTVEIWAKHITAHAGKQSE